MFAAVVIVVCLALLVLVIRRASRPRPATPLSEDGHWYWDGRKWQARLSKDGLWKWDGYGWSPVTPEGHVDTPAESLARAVTNPNPGSRFAIEWLISIAVAAVLIGLSVALNPLAHRAIDHAVVGVIGLIATRFLLSRVKVKV